MSNREIAKTPNRPYFNVSVLRRHPNRIAIQTCEYNERQAKRIERLRMSLRNAERLTNEIPKGKHALVQTGIGTEEPRGKCATKVWLIKINNSFIFHELTLQAKIG